MKKIFICCLVIIMCVSFAACGNDQSSDSSNAPSAGTESANDSDVETVTEEDGIRKEVVFTNKNLDITGETGPIKYAVSQIQVSKLTATTDLAATMLDIEKDKEVTLVVTTFDVENTSEDTISFYPDQAIMTTNTKEQVDAKMFLSDDVGGDFIGNVKKSGNVAFILMNSKADDLKNVTLHIDAPYNDSLDAIGDPVEISIQTSK